MKKILLAAVISLVSMNATYAAICSCDAPPECGRRPSTCFKPKDLPQMYSVKITSESTFDVKDSKKQTVGQYEGSSVEVESVLGDLFYQSENY